MAPAPFWSAGDYLTHRFNPELGVGRVAAVEARTLVVEFPDSGTTLRIAAATDALVRVDPAQARAQRPLDPGGALLERLTREDLDPVEDFAARLRLLRLLAVREAGGLGSFLGGRIRLFPHQLYVAGRATHADPVRWLLADEVGLGKTIEAALILNRLVHARRIERCVVVVPDALTVQWLGELWRKYHQVFTLLDAARLADVARDFGAAFNPFDVHRRVVIALEMLIERPELTEQAVRAGVDLLVVDEAQRLRRPPGHPGDPAWRAVAPIAGLGRHVLLLSATPLEHDAHGFFRLLQLLRPDEFPDETSVEDRLATGVPLPACTSSTRRADIGGLPPRVGVPVDFDAGAWAARDAVEYVIRTAPAPHAVARRHKIDRVRRAVASGAALAAVLGADEPELRGRAEAMDRRDPRLAWLLSQAPGWRDAGDKTLVFVAHRETLEMLRTALSHRAQVATAAFHEDMSPAQRDTEVARFREREGPSLLVSTESGGEGRNFEFCRRLVLFDLPWRPSLVEQRIGRLDRIGRRIPVEIVYFRPAGGIGGDAVRLFQTLGVFREPLAGLEPQLARVEAALEEVAVDPDATLQPEHLASLLADADAARTRIRDAAYQQLHRDPYRPEMAAAILARVPEDLDGSNQDAIISACERLGFSVERMRGRRAFSIELGNAAIVDSLPGVRGGSTYVGTFDREEAVERETLDFFASGHPLVEGIFAWFEEAAPGRVARVQMAIGSDRGEGLVALYHDAGGFDVEAIDATGRKRPEWARALRQRGLPVEPVTAPDARRDWATMVRRLAARLDGSRRPHALAAIVVRPSLAPRT